jgi:hypothetical protein
MFSSLKLVTALSLAALSITACSSSSGPSLDPAKTNCSNVCQKAHDCISQDTDVAKCTDNCDSKSSNDDVYKAKVGECADCAEPKACSEVSSCTGDCLRIYLP